VPYFSIVTPVFDPPLDAVEAMLGSVIGQTFADWELILVDDASRSFDVRRALERAAEEDGRITVITRTENSGIVVASNDAIDAARGEFIVLLDHDDLLERDALQRVREAVADADDVDYVYTDEDKIGADGGFFDRFDKPDWSPERLRGQMYTAHLSVMRTDLVRRVGRFHTGFEGSQDHDLVLRVTEKARRIVHIPEVLYHWRAVPGSTAEKTENKEYAWDAGVRAVAAHLQRVGIAATAERGPVPGTYRVVREPELDRSVSVIIPTRGTVGVINGRERSFVVEAVRSLLEKTRHRNVEIVVVYDLDTPEAALDELREIAGSRLVLVPFVERFNFSRKCNEGYLSAGGDILVFLNDDIEVISDEALGDLIAPLAEPDVGMTGAMLYFEDGSIQHAGHLYHDRIFTHGYFGGDPDQYGAFSSLLINRECSGLTAACIAIPRSVFEAVGGFSESLPANFNDVDLSFKVRLAGYRLVFLAEVRLHHFESRSRNPLVHSFEEQAILGRWGAPIRDPYLF
jgi:GT2 family glycosyltransferase